MNALFDHLEVATRILGSPVSAHALAAQTTRGADGRLLLKSLISVLQAQGFEVEISQRNLQNIPTNATPVVLMLKDEQAKVVDSIVTVSGARRYIIRQLDGTTQEYSEEALAEEYMGYCWFLKAKPQTDRRSELPEYTMEKSWFWKVLWRYRRYYYQIIIATVLINLLALVSSLYVMNVYDRVIPNKSYETLWVLSLGVLLVIAFEFLAKTIRGHLTDVAGKKADLVISAALFRRVMDIDLAEKPVSSGSYANNLRDFESVRDFMTSATLLTLVDLPFVLLFVFIIFVVAGPLALVPFISIPLVALIGFASQPFLEKYTKEVMKEGSQRAGLTVEAIEGIETLKTNNATNWAQQRWERYNAVTSNVSLKQKDVSQLVINLATMIQQMNTVFLVLWGTYLIHADDPASRITMGALIAAVILSGRAIAPLAQVAGLSMRYQQTKMAMEGIDSIVKRKTDRDPQRVYISLGGTSNGQIKFNDVSFKYPQTEAIVNNSLTFTINPGEKVGVLGKIGSGKSTMLRLACGMFTPEKGSVTLDGIDLRQIDPADLRGQVALFSQAPRLFLGTLRENLEMGRMDRFSSDRELLDALNRFGLAGMIQGHPKGLDMPIGEDGQGLSGGQKQVVALARLTLRNPKVVLLDEPTSGLDQNTEGFALNSIRTWAEDKTLLVVTHRPQVLAIVDRVIVVDNGRVVMDGPKQQVLQALTQGVNPNSVKPEPNVAGVGQVAVKQQQAPTPATPQSANASTGNAPPTITASAVPPVPAATSNVAETSPANSEGNKHV